MASYDTRLQEGGEDPEALVGILERQLRAEPAPSEGELASLRVRLSALYLEKLEDPLSAAVHVEELLRDGDLEPEVLELALSLLDCRPIAARIAEKLSRAFARQGLSDREMEMLEFELTVAKPERLEAVQRRLVELRQGDQPDPAGAFELLGQLVRNEPDDAALLNRYVEAAAAAEKTEEAIATLSSAHDIALGLTRARLGHALGLLYLQEGELPSARAAFLSAVADRLKDDAVLASARRLLALSREPEVPVELAPALEVVALQEPDIDVRQGAAERLLALGVFAEDDVRAIPSWQALLDSSRAEEALAKLEPLYERAGNKDGLAATLHLRALRTADTELSRALAVRSAELRSESGGDAAIEAWNFVCTYGPSREAHEHLVHLLEAAGRWGELCERLEASLEGASPHDAAAALAKLGQVRFSRLSQEDAALSSFERAVALEPTNALARVFLERLVAEGERRLDAAAILETASVAAGSDEGLLSALETKAELTASPEEALEAVERALAIAARAPERATRGLLLAGRGLVLVVVHRPADIPAWTARLREFAAAADEPGTEAELLFEAAQQAELDTPERVALASAAAEELEAQGRPSEALALAIRGLDASPGSLALSERVDRLTQGREPPEARLSRYETTLENLGDAAERRKLRHALAELARDGLADFQRAAAEWRAILADDPADERAQQGLVEAYKKTGDASFLPAELEGVMGSLDAAAQCTVLASKARALVIRGERDEALELCRALVANAEAGDDALESVATLAYEENEQDVYHEALERLASSGTAGVRIQALERLGHYFEQLGNRRAAAESWKPAAMLSAGDPAGNERARELYERVLAAAPDDCEAAERLLELYVSEGRWVNVPGIYAILLRASSDPGATAKKLLSLEERAIKDGAVDVLVGMLDETLPYLGGANEDVRRSAMLAKARVLAASEPRVEEASQAYRALIEAGGGDAALSAFESFVKERLRGKEQQAEKRWLFEWRAARSLLSPSAFVAWGKEEERQGELLGALRAYERAVELAPDRDEPLDALSRLRASQGDFEGALSALRTVRERAVGARRAELDLRVARILGEDLGRPEEALVSVAPLLSSSPPAAPALDIARRALERAEELDRTVELVERASSETTDPKVAAANLELLLEAPLDEASLGERRESWLVRFAEVSAAEPEEALRVLGNGIAQNPRSTLLWDAFIARARSAKRADAVYEAFARTIEHPSVDADTLERLGKKTIAFYDEWSSDSADVQKTLEVVLEHVPSARWALDRVKVLLFAGERWPELFRFYDRAIDAARNPDERAELLDEAALAARDLSRDAGRAISYLEQLRVLRPADAPVQASLERLYEREGESAKLITLLSERLASASGMAKEELEQRIASLWLDLGDLGSAHGLVERMLENGGRLADVVPLLERILGVRPEHDVFESPKTPHSRAVALLVEHFGALGQAKDVIRVRETELGFARGDEHRKRVVESLVGLYLSAGGDSDEAFVAAIPRVAAFGEHDEALGRAAAAKLLVLAEEAWKRRGASADSGAAQAAYWAARKLEDTALRMDDPGAAVRVLSSAAELPFERERQRALLRDAAIHLADRLGKGDRAVALLEKLFAEDPTDAVVTPHVDRFVRLLESLKTPEERSELWKSLGHRAVELGQLAHARGYFTLAAELWESCADTERAIAARRLSASLGSDVSLEILARLHRERGEWRASAEALEWAFAASGSGQKARLGSLLADACLELGERDRAAARLEAVLETVPDADDVRARLAALYRDAGDYRPLTELLVKGGRASQSAEQRLSMLREAADVMLTRLGEPARAIPILEAATQIAGADGELFLSLAGALDAAGRHADAARVLRGQIALHGELRPKSRATIHHRLARVLLHLKSPREAMAELRTATEIEPSNPEMLYDLARRALEENELTIAESTYRALLLSLHRAEPGEGPSRVDVYLDLSEIAARRNDHARAAEYIESSFDVSLEGLEEALRLEKSLAARGRDDLVARSVERRLRAAKDPAVAAAALAELLRLHAAHAGTSAELSSTIKRHADEIGKRIEEAGVTDAGIWTTLAAAAAAGGGGEAARAEVVGRRIALLTSAAERESGDAALGLLREAAVTCERDLSDPARALGSYESIVARFPSDWASWDALFRLSDASVAERLAALIAKALKKLKPVDERSRLRLGFASFLLTGGKSGDRATRVLSDLLDEQPDHPAAAELLADALEREGRHAELVTLLDARFSAARKAGRVPFALALRLGAALEQSATKERAERVYDAIVEDESADLGTLETVRGRLEALRSPGLADCLERLLSVPGGPAEPALGKRLVELRDAAGDAAGALRAAAIGFKLDPTDRVLRERLVRDYEERGLSAEACGVLARAVAASPDDRPLFLSWIDASARSGDRAGAIAALDHALEASPADTELLRERARAKQESGRDEDALADLERAYELDPSFAFDVRNVLERLVKAEHPEKDRHVLSLVDVLVEQGEQQRAGELLEQLLEERPEHVGGLERLAALRAANQDWPVAIAAYERLLPLVGGDHELFARLTLAFAEACDRAGGSAQARAALERAYEHAPDRTDLRERLEAIYEAEGNRPRLSQLLLSSAPRMENGPRRAAMFFRAAELLLEQGDTERALAAIESGMAADAANADGVLLHARALRALDRDREALDELLALAERMRGKPGPGVSRVHLAIAGVYLDADYLHEGFESLKHAFQLDPKNLDAAYLLGLSAIDLCDEATASRALRAVTAAHDDKVTRETKAMAFYHLARLAQWKNDKRRAQTMAKSALGENPDCDVAKALLEALGR